MNYHRKLYANACVETGNTVNDLTLGLVVLGGVGNFLKKLECKVILKPLVNCWFTSHWFTSNARWKSRIC